MPLYEYVCSCGKAFEVSQRMTEEALTSCLCDDKGEVRRLIGAGSGLIFKGSGFYITDYKNGSTSTESKSTENSTASKTETTKKETVPAGGCGNGPGGSCPCAES